MPAFVPEWKSMAKQPTATDFAYAVNKIGNPFDQLQRGAKNLGEYQEKRADGIAGNALAEAIAAYQTPDATTHDPRQWQGQPTTEDSDDRSLWHGQAPDSGPGSPQSSGRASLIHNESGGNWAAQNDAKGSSGRVGHFGRMQFGRDRLDEVAAGLGMDQITPEQFMQDPELQQRAEDWHFNDIDQFVQDQGLDQVMGQTIGGVQMTPDAMRAMAHLGGKNGLKNFVRSGGAYNPADKNGTRLSEYGSKHGGAGSSLALGGNQGSGQPQAAPYQSFLQSDQFKAALARTAKQGGNVQALIDGAREVDDSFRQARDLQRGIGDSVSNRERQRVANQTAQSQMQTDALSRRTLGLEHQTLLDDRKDKTDGAKFEQSYVTQQQDFVESKLAEMEEAGELPTGVDRVTTQEALMSTFDKTQGRQLLLEARQTMSPDAFKSTSMYKTEQQRIEAEAEIASERRKAYIEQNAKMIDRVLSGDTVVELDENGLAGTNPNRKKSSITATETETALRNNPATTFMFTDNVGWDVSTEKRDKIIKEITKIAKETGVAPEALISTSEDIFSDSGLITQFFDDTNDLEKIRAKMIEAAKVLAPIGKGAALDQLQNGLIQ